MILKEFPDIDWLKEKSRKNFADQTGVGGVRLANKGWPNVVLNTQSFGAERKDIVGPFSVFMNLRGSSNLRTEGSRFSIHADTYGITNKGQSYDLVIPDKCNTITFNIHFGEALFNETVYALRARHSSLLDEPHCYGNATFQTHPHTAWKDEQFRAWIDKLVAFYKEPDASSSFSEHETEILSLFLEFLLLRESAELKSVEAIPSLKASTRTELKRRVLLAVEYIHDKYTTDITLDDLSDVSSLSKFHLQRTFKLLKGYTPQQYVASLRLSKSRQLIENTALQMGDIAVQTGFSDVAAFSRFFYKQVKTYPAAYRAKISKEG